MATKNVPARRSQAQAVATTTQQQKKGDTALAVSQTMSSILLADQHAGMEGIGAQDLAIPRLSILQSGSPQVKKSEGAYIKGAEEGDILDNISNTVFKGGEGIIVIPVSFRRAHIEWVPRDDGGGFVADHGPDPAILSKCRKGNPEKGEHEFANILPNGHEIVPQAEYFCMIVDEEKETAFQAVVAMAKTQLKKAKKWNTMITQLMVPRPDGPGMFNPAMFYKSYKLTTVPESNDSGSWMGWKIEPYKDTLQLPIGEEVYMNCRRFRESVQAGQVKVAAPVIDDGGVVDDEQKF